MRKIYNEFFYISKHGKIREKVMLARVVTTAIIMIACLAAMSFTAYAYFSYNVTSGSNIIQAANFEADVSIKITDANGEAVTVNKVDSKTHAAVLEAGKTYYVTLVENKNSTATTGFCIITAEGCADIYHTQQLGTDAAAEGGKTETITFNIKASAKTTVTFLSHWGTSSSYVKDEENRLYITNENVGENAVNMLINGVAESSDDTEQETENTSTETAVSTETTTSTESVETTTSTKTETAVPSETTDESEDTTQQPQTETDSTQESSAHTTEETE